MIESTFITSIWDEGEYTGMGMDCPPFQAIVKWPYGKVKKILRSAQIEVVE